jgi:asparagine synthase (glutamine-hydrolysing)
MCGIAGILSLSPDARVDDAALRTMADQLRHRGPDDAGFYLDPQARCGFAFRRLSIIDLKTGNQPLSNEDGTIWTVLNGEIYNYRELRAELVSLGHKFATQSDTETIVHLYEQHGRACFERLSGMFAIAIWDQSRGRLLLARDRLGKKPLVYAVCGERLYFASEAKALLALPEMPRRLDPQSLHRYLIFQYVPAPHSIYTGFKKVLPGHYELFEAGAAQTPAWQEPRPRNCCGQAFWRVPDPPPFDGSYEDAKARLGELLTDAVAARLISDVPLGAFLSGGIDSSIVVGLMRKLGVSPLRTFSIGFADARYDETPYARRIAQLFATEHHEYTVTPQAREVLDTLAWHYDEPFADSSAIPTYYLSRWTRESVTVALTGDAGDECFAGYDRYRAAQLAGSLDRLPHGMRRGLAKLAAIVPHGQPKTRTRQLYRFLRAVSQAPALRYMDWVNIFSPAMLLAGYRPEFRAQLDLDEPVRWFDGLYNHTAGPPAARAIRTDFETYLPYDLLTKVDIASMACSLECRSPFLDHRLVEFALSLPLSWRLRGRNTKRILKDWAAGLLPPEIMARRKMGFAVPIGQWFRGELREYLRDLLFAPEALSGRIFRPEWLRDLFEGHLSGRANYEAPLWSLLMVELWFRRWQPVVP